MAKEKVEVMEPLLLDKGLMIKKNSDLHAHAKDLIQELNIKDPIEAYFVGAVDAMIYDMAFATSKRSWANRKKRKKIILKLWKKE